MIIDMHAHVWRNRQEQSLRTIRRAADIYHLDKVLISGLGSYSPDQAEISLLNAAVAAICEEDPLFAGYVYVDPLHQDAMDTLQYWLPHPCMVGMKLWVSCRCDETACDSLYEYSGIRKPPSSWPIWGETAIQMYRSLRIFPMYWWIFPARSVGQTICHMPSSCWEAPESFSEAICRARLPRAMDSFWPAAARRQRKNKSPMKTRNGSFPK